MIGRASFPLLAYALLVTAPVKAAEPAAGAPPPTIAAEDFGALPFFSNPRLSPDGSRIAATWLKEGTPLLALFDVRGEAAGPRFVALPDTLQLRWIRWAGNDKLIISFAAPITVFRVGEFFTTRLLVHDLKTGRTRSILKDKGWFSGDNVIHIDRTGRFLLVTMQETPYVWPAVWRVDLETLEAIEEVKPRRDVWNWYADSSGVVRAGLGSEGRRWWLLYRRDADAKFERVVTRRISKDDEAQIERIAPVTGSDQGYAMSNEATGRFALYRYDFATDTLGEPVYEHPEVDIDDFTLARDGNEVVAVEYVDDRPRVQWIDEELRALQEEIDRALPNAVNRVVSSNVDYDVLLIHSRAASNPGIFYVFDRKARRMEGLAAPYAALDGKQLAPTEAVTYEARDGLSIPAYLTLPLGRGGRDLPLIVMPHGGPFLRDKWEYSPWVQFLANRGYAVLQPNFRGSTGYGRAFVEAGEGEWGRKMQDDLDDGARWLAGRGIADPKRVCMMGASYGGYAAMWAAARNPELYRCAISFAGISDMRAMLRHDQKLLVAQRYYRDWRDRVRGDSNFNLDAISPIKAIDRISIPLLIAHGGRDVIVLPPNRPYSTMR